MSFLFSEFWDKYLRFKSHVADVLATHDNQKLHQLSYTSDQIG